MLRLLLLSALVAASLAAGIPSRVPMLDGRIVGGESVDISKHPYQVSLLFGGRHICGGSIISSYYILTAAHCTDGSAAVTLSIRAGSSIRGSGGVVIKVSRIIQNPNYSSRTIDYDASILLLSSPLPLNGNTISPINLVSSEASAGTTVVVTGWGTTSEGGSLPSQLQRVEVNTITRTACKMVYGSQITNRMMCAGGKGGKDSCQGDSGGPLAVSGKSLLVGIVSFGYGCARPSYPGVYANVAEPSIRQWIKDNTGI